MLQKVEVTIKKDGKVVVETSGFTGQECYDVTQDINLGKVVRDLKKDEAYERIPRVRRVNVGR